jgi:uncharacterized protein
MASALQSLQTAASVWAVGSMISATSSVHRYLMCSFRAIVIGALLCAGAAAAAAPVSFEESSLTVEAANGQFEFLVEMAVNPTQRSQGLMFRESLDEDRGMLFDFGRSQRAAMWMRNTYVPLDMLFIDAHGQITQIAADTQPLSDAVIASREPVRAVLELRGGVSAKLGIRPGDRVIHPMFSAP